MARMMSGCKLPLIVIDPLIGREKLAAGFFLRAVTPSIFLPGAGTLEATRSLADWFSYSAEREAHHSRCKMHRGRQSRQGRKGALPTAVDSIVHWTRISRKLLVIPAGACMLL